MVTENDRFRLPIHQNILTASPYIIVPTVHRVHQSARPLSLPAPKIQWQEQCDPCANISARKNINLFLDSFDLKKLFPISSADRTALAMMASIHGTFVLLLLDDSTCDILMYYFPSLADTIIPTLHELRQHRSSAQWILSHQYTSMLLHSPFAYT
jgi:hypothetical protein